MMQCIKTITAAACFTAVAASAFAQDTVDIPIDQAGAVATQALLAGETAVAAQIAEAVLTQRPDDRAALVVVAAAAPRLNNPERGIETGARAWRLSDTPLQRYEAARLTALAAAEAERFTTAAFWLRLALLSAPYDAERARTIADGRQVSQRNPLQVQLSFSLAPSTNVNGGAETDISSAPGNPDGRLSDDALALAGWRASLGFGANYRVQQNETSRTTVGFSLQASRVRLTDDTSVPDEAFDTNSIEARLRHERLFADGLLGISLSRGQFDYRDLDLAAETTDFEKYDATRLFVDYRYPVSDRTTVDVFAGRELLRYDATGIGEVKRTILGSSVSYRLESGDRISTTYRFVGSDGDNGNYTSDDHSLSVSYGFAEPFGDVTVALGGGVRWADYPEYRLLNPVTGGRQDETVFANVNLGFPEASIAGFIPGIRIDANRTDSNVSRFDRESLGASLTITSSF
ncbi:hypothetical protein [Yoonia litorea]|uniref:DUF560 domain-containing protein n=1 Tax=Yoonia litorea TaxID=1123755 RepID=A0A1I6MHN6_9RHOB|nr:hypothetical protein [Yoonia litorea]SFS15131.1 hypothetical protein SAMN05444714_1808 [Yoonia litorea]